MELLWLRLWAPTLKFEYFFLIIFLTIGVKFADLPLREIKDCSIMLLIDSVIILSFLLQFQPAAVIPDVAFFPSILLLTT